MRIVLLLAIMFNPFTYAKRVITNAFYATTNFFVNHIQPNQKGEAGKVVPVYIYNGTVGPTMVYGPEGAGKAVVPSNTTDVKSDSQPFKEIK